MVPKVLAAKNKYGYVAFCSLAALVILGFGNTLTNYFHCDDFLHTAYLYRVFNGEPGLLWQNFTSPWLQDRSFYTFFRPLTELSLALDYALYQGTALGYHLTNLFFHLANGTLLFFLARRLLLSAQVLTARETFLPALLTSAFFLVLPTHTEAVSWILSRSDLVATFFYLSTILLFLQSKNWSRALSLFTLLLACLSKEMAASLPLTLLVLNIGKSWKDRWKETYLHFVVLALYLGWRGLSLGTAYGGYSGSLGERMRGNLIERWISSEALYQIFLPFNDELIDKSNALRPITRIIYSLFALLIVGNYYKDETLKNKWKLILTTCLWALLTLLPSLEVLGVTDHMSGGRILYLPAAPIALALVLTVLCLRERGSGALVKVFSILTLTAAIICATIAVRINNLSWQRAGAVSANLRSEILKERQSLDSSDRNKQLVIFNVPGQVQGAYTFTIANTFKGLIAPPFCPNLNKTVTALDFHPFWSDWINYQDFLTLISNPQEYKVLYFEQDKGQLKALPNFKESLSKSKRDPLTLSLVAEESDRLKENKEFYYSVKPKVNPAEFQILEITWQDDAAALFFYWNDKARNFDRETLFVRGKKDGQKKISNKSRVDYLPLCNYKSWLTNTTDISTIKVLATGQNQSPPQLRLLQEETVSPLFKRETFGNANMTFDYDGEKIAGAKSMRVEITRAYRYFSHYSDHPRDAQPLKDPLKSWTLGSLKGKLTIAESDLPQAGYYQIRVGALDKDGQLLGLYSEAETLEKK